MYVKRGASRRRGVVSSSRRSTSTTPTEDRKEDIVLEATPAAPTPSSAPATIVTHVHNYHTHSNLHNGTVLLSAPCERWSDIPCAIPNGTYSQSIRCGVAPLHCVGHHGLYHRANYLPCSPYQHREYYPAPCYRTCDPRDNYQMC